MYFLGSGLYHFLRERKFALISSCGFKKLESLSFSLDMGIVIKINLTEIIIQRTLIHLVFWHCFTAYVIKPKKGRGKKVTPLVI
jgi:hypothetical protein